MNILLLLDLDWFCPMDQGLVKHFCVEGIINRFFMHHGNGTTEVSKLHVRYSSMLMKILRNQRGS